MNENAKAPVESAQIIQEFQNEETEIVDKNSRSMYQKIIIIINTRRYQLMTVILLATLLMATFAYFMFTDERESVENIKMTCLVNQNYRIDCNNVNISASACNRIGCCYDEETLKCYHSIPSKYGYIKDGSNYKRLEDMSPFRMTMLDVELIISNPSAERLDIKLRQSNDKSSVRVNLTGESKFKVEIAEELLALKIYRHGAANNDVLLATNLGPLIVSSGYWQWTFEVTNSYLYGLDEFFLTNKTTRRIIYKNSTQHHVVPSFIAHNSKRFHGLTIDHKGPLEVTVLSSNLIDVRGLGENITISLFIGPTPKDIYEQMSGKSGTFNLETWMLKPHICRNGNESISSILTELNEFQTENKIEYGSDCLHEKLYGFLHEMSSNDLDSLRKVLLRMSENFVFSVPPHVLVDNNLLYEKAKSLGILFQYEDDVAYGTYKKRNVAYVDFSNSNSGEWIEGLMKFVQEKIGSSPKNVMFTDNWLIDDTLTMKNPENFSYWNNDFKSAMSRELAWNASTSSNVLHYLIHNDYAVSQIEAYEKVANVKVFATSSYTYNIKQPANVQALSATWTTFKKSLRMILSHSLFGNPYISVPVCGSTGNFDERLCIRWYLMAATMPIFRISSDKPRRDPSNLPSNTMQNYATEIINRRRQFLPYYYNVLNGNKPLMRPMFYEFPDDIKTYTLDEQYMVGGFLLVAHPVLPSQNHINVYLPQEIRNWFEFWDGINYDNGWIEFPIIENDWNMFIAAGYTIPLLLDDQPTVITLKLVIALDCTHGTCQSNGIFNYDGFKFRFSSDEDNLTVTNESVNNENCSSKSVQIELVSIYGLGADLHSGKYSVPINLCDVINSKVYPY